MKRGPKPLQNIDTTWRPELAYAVGLLAADGNLSKDGRHIDFTSKDKDLVITFKRCLNIKNKIGRKTSGYTGTNNYFHVQFGSVIFYTWLLGVGLTPKKSKTIGFLKIPDEYFFDFLRGSFDGDGTIYSYWDPRWHSSYMFYLRFISASRKHLEWLQKTIVRLCGIFGNIKESRRVYSLEFAKAGTYTIFGKMFYKDGLPCLKRKFIKHRKIFSIDRNHNKL